MVVLWQSCHHVDSRPPSDACSLWFRVFVLRLLSITLSGSLCSHDILPLLTAFLLTICFPIFLSHTLTATNSCDVKSCHPETGNLLVGREKQLHASSTCGTKGPVPYCVISGVNQRKKCFICDADPQFKDDRFKYHGIENIIPSSGKKRNRWWQAENGVENVTIQLDLGSEFQFTHLMIRFQTFRPAAMILERSKEYGHTWEVYQYFAYDCATVFPHVKMGQRRQLNDVTCIQEYSQTDAASLGEVVFKVLPSTFMIAEPYAPEVQNLLKLTNLRLNMTKLHTLGDNLLDQSSAVKEKYYYAIDKMIVRGKCSCYGHAKKCVPAESDTSVDVPEMVYGKCQCQHHTTGKNCEFCEDLYNDLEWHAAIGDEIHACKSESMLLRKRASS